MYDGVEHNPKLLPCSHTVCLDCLDRIVATFARDTGQFRCPICRELITIPRGGVVCLPPSFLVNQLLDLMARQRREVIPKCSTHQTQVNNKIRKTLRSISFVSEGDREVGNVSNLDKSDKSKRYPKMYSKTQLLWPMVRFWRFSLKNDFISWISPFFQAIKLYIRFGLNQKTNEDKKFWARWKFGYICFWFGITVDHSNRVLL